MRTLSPTDLTRHRASTSMYWLTFCVRIVARTPPVEARSPDCRSNVENAPPPRRLVTGKPATATSHIRRAISRTPPVTRQSPASSARRPRPDGRSLYVVIGLSRDGRKLVTRVRVMLPLAAHAFAPLALSAARCEQCRFVPKMIA